MFNDKCGLTKAVLEGRKTMTRRIICEGAGIEVDMVRRGHVVFPIAKFENGALLMDASAVFNVSVLYPAPKAYQPKYYIGEVVAIAQAYKQVPDPFLGHGTDWRDAAGWSNKMFVRAEDMPHQIRITGIKAERLQDICEEDCLREGIIRKWIEAGALYYYYIPGVEVKSKNDIYPSARDAFAALIDKVSGKGTWAANPWVLVYSFEPVK